LVALIPILPVQLSIFQNIFKFKLSSLISYQKTIYNPGCAIFQGGLIKGVSRGKS
jgi:hypothetical protein